MIDENLRKKLKDLSTPAAARIYTGTAPQQPEFPLAVMRRTGGNTPRTLGNVKLFSRAQFTIASVGRNYADSLAVATAIRNGLDGYKGALASEPAGSDTTVKSCRAISDFTDISEADGDQVLRGVSQDFLLVYLET